jgi:hypothetical protein
VKLKIYYRLLKVLYCISCISLKEKKKRAWDRGSEAWNKQSSILTKNQMLEVIPERREKEDNGYVYCIYIYVRVF